MLNAFETGSEARQGIGHWIDLYNSERPHSAHAGATPEEVYTGLKKHSEQGPCPQARPLSEFPLLAATRTAESTLERTPMGSTSDQQPTVAAIDRVVHHSVILELNVSSYRMESAKKKQQETTK